VEEEAVTIRGTGGDDEFDVGDRVVLSSNVRGDLGGGGGGGGDKGTRVVAVDGVDGRFLSFRKYKGSS
jgi:hypothetical protein